MVGGTTSIGHNFPTLNNLGPDNASIPVLTQVGLPDGSRYNFEYTNTYGMVSTIHNYAPDHSPPNIIHERRYTTYVAPANAADCPRLTERHDWAENWNGDSNDTPAANEEAITYFGHDTSDGACRMTAPDGTVYKEYYAGSAAFQPACKRQKHDSNGVCPHPQKHPP